MAEKKKKQELPLVAQNTLEQQILGVSTRTTTIRKKNEK